MDMVNPEHVRLRPGQSMEAVISTDGDQPGEVAFFVRSLSNGVQPYSDIEIQQRAGVVRYDNVLLALTMLKVTAETEEVFDIWWNYYGKNGMEHFRRIAEQDTIRISFTTEEGVSFSIKTENTFKRFFKPLSRMFEKADSWTDVEFDRAVHGFCALSYPKEKLWNDLEKKPAPQPEPEFHDAEKVYSGYIPDDLRPFYIYDPEHGHCLKIIPSILEQDALVGNPEELLYPAPIKTALRCDYRWIKGFPIAAIPFIPGMGLAGPPEDKEY